LWGELRVAITRLSALSLLSFTLKPYTIPQDK